MFDVEPLLAATGSMPPCGVDLEYDADFLELEALASAKPERQFQEEADEPPWHDVMARVSALLGRSKDLRLAITYTRAAAHDSGLRGFHAGLRILTGMLDRYWDDLYPPLDAEDDNSSALRVNALAALADPYTPFDDHVTLLHDLRAAQVCQVPGERLSVRDILIGLGKLTATAGDRTVTLSLVQGVLAEAVKQDREALADALSLPQTVEQLANLMSARFGATDAPSLTVMMSVAQSVAGACRAVVAEPSTPASGVAMNGVASVQQTGFVAMPSPDRLDSLVKASSPKQGNGQLATRDDAIAMLDAVCTFLEKTEPTNPAPLLIRRARALMGKDFIAIMQDLAPDSLAQIHQIVGKEPE